MNKALKDVHALVIEDEVALNEAYVTILKSEHIKVDAAYDGQEALEILKKVTPDIILLDLRMPTMSGIEFLRRFSKLKSQKNAKIIIFSNYDKQEEINEAFELGAAKYLLKAWASPSEILKVIKGMI
jgi:DNA-binding response OmpR family regulator